MDATSVADDVDAMDAMPIICSTLRWMKGRGCRARYYAEVERITAKSIALASAVR